MVQRLLFYLILGLSFEGFALPQDFQFKESTLLQFMELGRQAQVYLLFEPKASGRELHFQSALTETSFSKAILASTYIKAPASELNRIFKHKKGYYTHLQLSSQRASVFFLGYSKKEVEAALTRFRNIYGRAPASEVASGRDSGLVSPAFSASPQEYAYALGGLFLKCAQGLVDGANALIVDSVVDFGKSAYLAASDWDRFWSNSVEEWNILKDSILNFEKVAGQKYKNFKTMPESEKSRLYCSFVGGGGAGGTIAAASKKLIKASISKRGFGKMPSVAAQNALRDLKTYLASPQNISYHHLSTISGKTTLHIGSLQKSQSTFMRLTMRALKTGAIKEIDAGSVEGPKVLNALNRLKEIKPDNGEPVIFRGNLNPRVLEVVKKNQLKMTQDQVSKPGDATHWSPEDVKDYERAIGELKIREACKSVWKSYSLGKCLDMSFQFQSDRPQNIRWFQAVRVQ